MDDNSNTKSEEGTIAFHKKRARRVSFAENTSVHIFDRDEDAGSPLNPNKPPNSPSIDSPFAQHNHEPNQLFWNVTEEDIDNEDDDLDEPGSRSPFLRFVGSPSSGGSTIGSANSNDEDNYFGPVSTSFIRRDLLDFEASDGNHDQTMDSTAFSMHFRSLARSESEVELKTSAGVHLSFEEKTPTHDSISTNTGTSMLMTLAKKPNNESSASASKLSTGSESNDMSIVGEYRYKYNYGELSPTLDVLLAEGGKDLHVINPSNVSIRKSPSNVEATKENGEHVMDFICDEDDSLQGISAHEMVNEVVSPTHNELGVVNDGLIVSPTKQIALGVSSDASDADISKHLLPSSTIMATPNANSNEIVKDPFQIKSSLGSLSTSHGNPNPKNTIYLDGAIGKEHTFLSKSPSTVTPYLNHSSAFVRSENPKHSWSVPSIEKSISKLKMLEASPFSAALNAKLEDSVSKMNSLNTLVVRNYSAPSLNFMNENGQLSSAGQKKRGRASSTNTDDIRSETPIIQNFTKVASPLLIPAQNTRSGEKMQTNLLSLADTDKSGLSQHVGYSPQKKLKIVNTLEFRSSPSRDAQQLSKHNEPGHVAGSGENANKADALYIEKSEKFSPLISTEKESEGNSTTLLKDEEPEKFHTNITGSDIATEETKRASMVSHERTDIPSCQKNLHDEFCQSPSAKELYNTLHDDNLDSLMDEIIPSPSLHRLSNGDVISETQRKAEAGVVERTARTQKNPNVSKDCASPELPSENRIPSIGYEFKHPTEINTMLSKEMKELLFQSVDKFNLHAINRLAGIVDQLQRSKTYQLLYDKIQSQKNVDASDYISQKRAAEMKLLLCKLVHEKAKSQLLHVQRERLQNRVELLAGAISESEVLLNSNVPPQEYQDTNCQPSSVNMKDLQESQIDSDKVTSMGLTLDHIDARIANLTKSFHKSCMMKGELCCDDTISFVNNYIKKRSCSQIMRKNLQLWTIDNLESKNGCHNVVLNYLDLVTQRLTINADPVSSISISHKLNSINISKIFKDMDACAAFGFVFNNGRIQKHVGAASLAQETQVTGSLFGNLLDVMEEIHQARIELKNLISTRFDTPLAKQLNLKLCFFDAKSHKATVTFDVSCLGRGIYPSEVLPYHIDILTDEPQSSSSSFSAETTSAFQDLKVGYFRIKRLCTCISKLISPPIRLRCIPFSRDVRCISFEFYG